MKVYDGSTVTDFDEEEIARKHTLSSSLAHTEWQKAKINIIDTPGMANFLTDAQSALRVVEGAVLAVDRLERDRASLERTLESLHRDCAREIVPIQIPLGEERGFTGVVDLVRMRAPTFAWDGRGAMKEEEIPAALAE